MTTRMTRTEASDLQRVVRMNHKLARSDIDGRAATVLAEFEEQLAREYSAKDQLVADLVVEARETVERLNAELERRCTDAGIPSSWAPSMYTGFSRRGENASAERRGELRRVAVSRMDQMKRDAKLQVDRSENKIATALIANQLDGTEAKEWLAAMPTAESLIPVFEVAEIERAKNEARAAVRSLMP